MGFVGDIRPCLPLFAKRFHNRRVTSLHGHYPTSHLLLTRPPPSCLRPLSSIRLCRAVVPFSMWVRLGQEEDLQLLGIVLVVDAVADPPRSSQAHSPCFHCVHVSFVPRRRIRPPGLFFSGPPLLSLSLRPDDSAFHPEGCGFVNGLPTVGFPPACHSS